MARTDRSLDARTRMMPVAVEVANAGGEPSPGMFAQVAWRARRARTSRPLPPTAVVTATERTFVVRVTDGRAAWVDVWRGGPAGDSVEVLGALQPGDVVVRRATDEIRPGQALRTG